MAESGPRGGGERRGFGGRGRGGPGGRGGPRGKGDDWVPMTKLGRLVKGDKIQSLEEIYTHSIPIKEAPIVDKLVARQNKTLSDEVMKIISVQKQTKAGQRTRFKAVVVIGDQDGHVGLGIKVAKEVQIAIKGALVVAKLNLIPVRRGYWGNKIGKVHTIAAKCTGKGGSVRVKLVPAPRGTGIVAAPVPKKILQFAGIEDVYTCSSGHTRTPENFIKATFAAVQHSYCYLSPDLWTKTENVPSPFGVHAEFLINLEKEAKQNRHRRDGAGRGGRDGRGRGRGGDRGRGRGGDRGRGPRGPREPRQQQTPAE